MHASASLASWCRFPCLQVHNWPRGVTVSTLDSESSDRGSNPREASYSSCTWAFPSKSKELHRRM